MKNSSVFKAGVLTAVLVAASIVLYEVYWRNNGFPISYNDDEALWSDKRAMVYEPSDKATVFIGSSRIKFDLDIPTWQRETGEHAIQLAMVGSTPRPTLEDLADDKSFKGKLIVDVTEGLFFMPRGMGREKMPRDNIAYYKKRTPAQKASFVISEGLESQLVFLQQSTFSINALLQRIAVEERPGVRGEPKFPPKFSYVSFDRQTSMSNEFVSDTVMQREVKNIWLPALLFSKPVGYDSIVQIFKEVKVCVDKIRSRGGTVLFVRTPSSDDAIRAERLNFPREKYWDALLDATNTPGIHFEDYPAMAHFTCPEWSHLNPVDAVLFTKAFIKALREKGWPVGSKTLVAKISTKL